MQTRTRELFWHRSLGSYREADAVAWALGELEETPASPNLSTLAGLIPPYNVFEVEDLLRVTPPREALCAGADAVAGEEDGGHPCRGLSREVSSRS
jgi:hypothetical protein